MTIFWKFQSMLLLPDWNTFILILSFCFQVKSAWVFCTKWLSISSKCLEQVFWPVYQPLPASPSRSLVPLHNPWTCSLGPRFLAVGATGDPSTCVQWFADRCNIPAGWRGRMEAGQERLAGGEDKKKKGGRGGICRPAEENMFILIFSFIHNELCIKWLLLMLRIFTILRL